jgi:hypothetical protein
MASPFLDWGVRIMAKKSPPVVVLHVQPESEGRPRLLVAFLCSFLLNGFIVGVFFVSNAFTVVAATGDASTQEEVVPFEPPDQPEPKIEPDVGLDPTQEKGFNDVEILGKEAIPTPVSDPALDPGVQGDPNQVVTALPKPTAREAGDDQGNAPRPQFSKEFMPSHNLPDGGLKHRVRGETRSRLAARDGGSPLSEAAVARGLDFLKAHQSPQGNWSFTKLCEHGRCNCTGQANHDDIAATAFGILPFLGGGFTHKNPSKYTKNIEDALRFLTLRQNRDGEFHPLMYSHALATMAICEAYGLTDDIALRGPAQRAIDYLVDAQSKEGGWRYGRKQPGYDTSVGGWALMALKSGQMANLRVPVESMNRAKKWLDDAGTADGSGYGYTSRGEGVNTTAVGLLCREYLGWGPRNLGLQAGIQRLEIWKPQPANMYFSYYATQVMHHAGGPAWDRWNPVMRDSLIASQDQGTDPLHAHQKGSWYHTGCHGGRLMDTSLSILTLEVYYRHLPLYRRGVGTDKEILEQP